MIFHYLDGVEESILGVYERGGVVKKFLVMGATDIGKVASLELTIEEVFFQLFCLMRVRWDCLVERRIYH